MLLARLVLKIKIKILGGHITATPINTKLSSFPQKQHRPRGENGLPPSSAGRIRAAVNELGGDALFSTVLLAESPTPNILNRIRTHLDCNCVGVVEFGLKNGWHIHIVHERNYDDAHRILSNYGQVHTDRIQNCNKTAWYMTKSIGLIPPDEHPISWYFCTRELGRAETFYIDSTVMEVVKVGEWKILDYFLISKYSLTTVAHLKNLPPWIEPGKEI